MGTVNKSDMIDAIAKATGTPRAAVDEIVTALLTIIREEADAGNIVALHSFGRFEVRERAARAGRNPKTGEPVTIAARRALTFKPSKAKA